MGTGDFVIFFYVCQKVSTRTVVAKSNAWYSIYNFVALNKRSKYELNGRKWTKH